MYQNDNGLKELMIDVLLINFEEITLIFDNLNSKEKQVISLSYGLDDVKYSVPEIAAKMRISKSNVERIKAKAIGKINSVIRSYLVRSLLTEYHRTQEMLQGLGTNKEIPFPLPDFQKSIVQDRLNALFREMGHSFETLSRPVESLGLSNRIINSLHNGGILTIYELILRSEKDLRKLRWFGETSLKEVNECLKANKLKLLSVMPYVKAKG